MYVRCSLAHVLLLLVEHCGVSAAVCDVLGGEGGCENLSGGEERRDTLDPRKLATPTVTVGETHNTCLR